MRPLMPNWMLHCAHCNASFVHSEVVAASFYDPFYLAPKPSFPDGGISLICPHCRTSSVYQRFQLTYSALR